MNQLGPERRNETASSGIHSSAVIIDGLFCNTHIPIPPTPEVDDLMFGHIINSGVTAFSNSVIADAYPQSFNSAIYALYHQHVLAQAHPGSTLIVERLSDIEEAKATGRTGMILSAQGLHSIGGDTRHLWTLYRLGLRIAQLTYNETNALGSGCKEPTDYGLTRVGQKVIEEMNLQGMVVDVSHAGDRTALDVAQYSRKPVVASHAAVRSLNPHPRNLTDDGIRAVADTGGVIGLCPHSIFIEKARGERPTLADFLEHIHYVAALVGIEHVGIGTDNFQYESFYTHVGRHSFERTYPGFFGGYGTEEKHVAGFSKWEDWPHLTEALVASGFSETQCTQILGGNFVRVFSEVWT